MRSSAPSRMGREDAAQAEPLVLTATTGSVASRHSGMMASPAFPLGSLRRSPWPMTGLGSRPLQHVHVTRSVGLNCT
eukprot:11863907-Alexandrium_andersonii.AAC.1